MFTRFFKKKSQENLADAAQGHVPAARLSAVLGTATDSKTQSVAATTAAPTPTVNESNLHHDGLLRPQDALFPNPGAMIADTWNRLSPETQITINEKVVCLKEDWDRREQEAQGLLAKKREHAKFQFGQSSAIACLLDQLVELIPVGKYEHAEGEKQVRAELRSMGADKRRDLFDYILALKIDRQWGDEPARQLAELSNNRKIDTEEYRFELIVECQLLFLLENGFSVDLSLSEWILDYLANGVTSYYLQLQDQLSRDYNKKNLGIVKQIAREVQKGMQLSDTARNNATVIFDRYCDVRNGNHQAFFDTGKKMDKVCEALLEIGQVQKPTSLLDQMRENQDCRALSAHAATPEEIKSYEELKLVFREAWALIEDIKVYRTGNRSEANWLTDATLFEQKFGLSEMPTSGGLCFDWWTRDTMAQPGFAKVVSNENFEHLQEWFDHLLTADQFDGLLSYLSGDTSFFPYVFTRNGIPDIDALTFKEHQAAAEFLDHLVSFNGSKPSKAWLKKSKELIDKIGKKTVFDGFLRWTSNIYKRDINGFNWNFLKVEHNYKKLAGELEEEAKAWSGSDNREFLYRQLAMRAIARGGAQLANGTHPAKYKIQEFRPQKKTQAGLTLLRPLSDMNVSVMRGVIWAASLIDNEMIPEFLENLGKEMFSKHYGDFRSKACGNAVLWSLGLIGTIPAVHALARIRRSIKDKSIANLVDAALSNAAVQHDLALEDMQELSMADYGFGIYGCRVEQFGQYEVRLEIVSSNKAMLTTVDTQKANPKPKRGIIKSAQQAAPSQELVDELNSAADDISRLLPEVKQRLENACRQKRSWSCGDWKERFYDNGLVATLTTRLIWSFRLQDGEVLHLIPTKESHIFIDGSGNRVSPQLEGSTVELWHPLTADGHQVASWRETLRMLEMRQPFMQAWRPIYVVTDAELQTGTYSNRFSGHILHQPPAVAMLRKRGWIAGSKILGDGRSDDKQNQVVLPAFGVSAQYWVAGVGDRIQQPTPEQAAVNYGWADNFEFISTDRLVFFAIDKESRKASDMQMRMEDVPPMAFSEIMRDIDVVIGATSIGNDRFWIDRGADAQPPVSSIEGAANYRESFIAGHNGELTKMRHAFLNTLLPSLSIANQCSLTDKWLIVDGQIRTYKIHLGSGNTLMAPNDQYLCIVEIRSADETASQVYLPFEGDPILSMILSKAFLLSEDSKITDPVIVAQINQN